jgi:hypothetical protein
MNEFKETNPAAPVEPVEKPATRIKRAYRKRKAEGIEKQSLMPRAFVEVASKPLRAEPTRSSRREAGLPDPKWMAEFVKTLLGVL